MLKSPSRLTLEGRICQSVVYPRRAYTHRETEKLLAWVLTETEAQVYWYQVIIFNMFRFSKLPSSQYVSDVPVISGDLIWVEGTSCCLLSSFNATAPFFSLASSPKLLLFSFFSSTSTTGIFYSSSNPK